MTKLSAGRITAISFFLILIIGAYFCFQRLAEDIASGKYFTHAQELQHQIVFLVAYTLIILLALRYGYYLAIGKVSWATIKNDFLYLLNRRHFSKWQWIINIILFWLALVGFVYSLAISTMQGSL